MTEITEQQAREALTVLLASVRVEGHHLDRAEDARKTLIDFITQAAEDKSKLELYSSLASKYEELRKIIDGGSETYTHEDALFRVAEDKRIADAVRGGERFWRAVWGETADGKVTIDREEIVGIPASVLEGE